MNSEKTNLLSLRNIKWRTLKIETNKINQVLPYISTNNITELNELIFAGAKLVCENIRIPLKSRKKKSKPGWEIRLETQIQNLRKQTKMIKEKRDTGICGNRKEKATREKITVQLEEINQKVLAKEGRLKRCRQRVKQYRQNRTFQNNERKFYQQLGGHDTKTYLQPDSKETEWFWTKIWQPKQRKGWMDAQYDERTRRAQEGPKAEIQIDLLKKTLKRYQTENARPWWNIWFLVQEIHLHSRQTSTRKEQMLTRSTSTWMDDQMKDHIDPKGPKQRNCFKRLQTHNLPTDDVENINSTNMGRDLLLANKQQIVPWQTERMPQKSRGTAELLYIDQHILNESKTRRKNLAMAWIDYKRAYDMVPQSWIINCLKMKS